MPMSPAPDPNADRSTSHLQPAAKLRHRHLLGLADFDADEIRLLLQTARAFREVLNRPIKSVPSLRGVTCCNLFFENSTRTRATFELAAKRLSADVLNLDIKTSSAAKGESLMDTLVNLEAMQADAFVVRHGDSGAAHFIASQITPHVAIINAGDGRHAHPTQAMLDMLTIRRHKGEFANLRVAIVGDILHSRVARSQIQALNTLGAAEVRVVAPQTLLPIGVETLGCQVFTELAAGLKDVDVVIMLRLQKERMDGALLPSESEYYRRYGLTRESLAHAHPDAVVMHPGPINRGVEIESAVADGPRSLILDQVTNGIAVRMAVLSMAVSGQMKARAERRGERSRGAGA